MILTFLATPLGRGAIVVAALVLALIVNNSHQREIGAKKAVATIEKATNDAIDKAATAGNKSAAGHGVRPLSYRD